LIVFPQDLGNLDLGVRAWSKLAVHVSDLPWLIEKAVS